MLSGMNKPPKDPNQRAKFVIETAFGGMVEKNPAAVALGSMGGKARAEALTGKKRSEIAKKAAKARWAKD